METRLQGRKVRDLQIAALEHPNNIQVIGLIQNGEYILNPSSQHTIEENEKLIILAEKSVDFEDVEASILKQAAPQS